MREVKARCMGVPIGCGGEVRDRRQSSHLHPRRRRLSAGWLGGGSSGRVKFGGLACHERADTAAGWRAFSFAASSQPTPSQQPQSPISSTTRRIPFLPASLAGHLHHSPLHATGIFPLATPPSALPEPLSISLRLHHCTSPTTHPHPRAW